MSENERKPTDRAGQTSILPVDGLRIRETAEIETDLIVFGYMAAHWSNTGAYFGCCKRGWGEGLRSGAIQVGNDTYTCGQMFSEKNEKTLARYGRGVLGMVLTCHIDQRNGGKRQRTVWMPMAQFQALKVEVEGMEL